MANLSQHVTCQTIHWTTVTHKHAYKSSSQPAFVKSDHSAIFLIPEYQQSFHHEALVIRKVQRWSVQLEAMLQDALDDVDWDMFRVCVDDINKFADVAVSFVSKLVNKVIPRVKILPN